MRRVLDHKNFTFSSDCHRTAVFRNEYNEEVTTQNHANGTKQKIEIYRKTLFYLGDLGMESEKVLQKSNWDPNEKKGVDGLS